MRQIVGMANDDLDWLGVMASACAVACLKQLGASRPNPSPELLSYWKIGGSLEPLAGVLTKAMACCGADGDCRLKRLMGSIR